MRYGFYFWLVLTLLLSATPALAAEVSGKVVESGRSGRVLTIQIPKVDVDSFEVGDEVGVSRGDDYESGTIREVKGNRIRVRFEEVETIYKKGNKVVIETYEDSALSPSAKQDPRLEGLPDMAVIGVPFVIVQSTNLQYRSLANYYGDDEDSTFGYGGAALLSYQIDKTNDALISAVTGVVFGGIETVNSYDGGEISVRHDAVYFSFGIDGEFPIAANSYLFVGGHLYYPLFDEVVLSSPTSGNLRIKADPGFSLRVDVIDAGFRYRFQPNAGLDLLVTVPVHIRFIGGTDDYRAGYSAVGIGGFYGF